MAHLVLIRHGTSEYNAKGLWAGWDNPNLTEEGRQDAVTAGRTLQNITLDAAYTSPLIRHKQTLEIVLQALGQTDLPINESEALKERNYGDFTGKNKWEIKKQIGEEEFIKLRRSWNYPIPNGESLKQVSQRVVPYYETTILPLLKEGKTVIVSSSGNALRSLVKYLEHISDEDVPNLEIAPGEVYVYKIDESGKIVTKDIRNQHENKV